MKRIITLAIVSFALIKIGAVDLPEQATAWVGEWTVADTPVGSWKNAAELSGSSDTSRRPVVARVPLREPSGAFLQKVLDIFDLYTDS